MMARRRDWIICSILIESIRILSLKNKARLKMYFLRKINTADIWKSELRLGFASCFAYWGNGLIIAWTGRRLFYLWKYVRNQPVWGWLGSYSSHLNGEIISAVVTEVRANSVIATTSATISSNDRLCTSFNADVKSVRDGQYNFKEKDDWNFK